MLSSTSRLGIDHTLSEFQSGGGVLSVLRAAADVACLSFNVCVRVDWQMCAVSCVVLEGFIGGRSTLVSFVIRLFLGFF